MFILSLLTNSLHSEPTRHAQASLKEALNNTSISFRFINFPIFFFFLSHSLSFILMLSLEGVTSYTGIWFTNPGLLHTKIQITRSMAVLQRHALPQWCHFLVSLVFDFGTLVPFWAPEWQWPGFRRCLAPTTSRGSCRHSTHTREHFYAKHLPGSGHSSIKLLFWIQLHSVVTQEIISPGVKLRTLGLAVI